MSNKGEKKATGLGTDNNNVNFAKKLDEFKKRNAALVKQFSEINARYPTLDAREKHFAQCLGEMGKLQASIRKLRSQYQLTEKQSAALSAVESSVQSN